MSLNIVVALAAEARVLIDALQLKQVAQKPFALYQKDHIRLTVSGVGKIKAAMAVAHVAGSSQANSDYLNVGIAGHQSESIGTCLHVHKIKDMSSQRSFYPYVAPRIEQQSGLCTVEQVLADYPEPILYDMEASGFYQAASLVTHHDRIRLIKIVSDNQDCDHRQVNKAHVLALFEKNLEELLDHINGFAQKIRGEPSLFSDHCAHLHFSAYQQAQLKQLLRRAQILFPEERIIQMIDQVKTGADLLKQFEYELSQPAIYTW